VAFGASGNLRCMRDEQNLCRRGEPLQSLANGIRDRAADSAIHFVED
jgi:hypothetical protein